MKKTKVFGIGLSKTGTTSLCRALNILGFKAKDYPRGLNIIDKYDAATDITVAHYFKQLDKKYPSSKFILTVRDKTSWLTSMFNHHKKHPPSKRDDFILDMRIRVWGSIEPTKEQMAGVYEKHTNEVGNYFRNRQKDLLVMNIIEGEGWEKLCPFLNKSIPGEPFPWVNKTKPD